MNVRYCIMLVEGLGGQYIIAIEDKKGEKTGLHLSLA